MRTFTWRPGTGTLLRGWRRGDDHRSATRAAAGHAGFGSGVATTLNRFISGTANNPMTEIRGDLPALS